MLAKNPRYLDDSRRNGTIASFWNANESPQSTLALQSKRGEREKGNGGVTSSSTSAILMSVSSWRFANVGTLQRDEANG